MALLAALAEHHDLLELVLDTCTGVASADVWLGVAAARKSPLKVSMKPALGGDILAECSRLALELHGSVFLTFDRLW